MNHKTKSLVNKVNTILLRFSSKGSFLTLRRSRALFLAWCFFTIIIIVLSAVSNVKADSPLRFGRNSLFLINSTFDGTFLKFEAAETNAIFSSAAKLPTAEEIFSKAMEAESTVDYVGRQIVILWHSLAPSLKDGARRAGRAFEERVIHQTPSTHIIELLMPIKMSPPRGRFGRVLPPPPPRKLQDIWEMDIQLLLRNYTVDLEKGEPIAGRSTYLLQINPKVSKRPKKKVWLDAQHYTILRMEDYDITEKINSLSVYTTIDYDSASVAKHLKRYLKEQSEKEQERSPNPPRPYQSEEVSFAEAEKQFGTKLPQPHLPTGFQLQSISVMTFRGKRIHLRYTDGLTTLSLFVSKVGDEEEARRRRSIEDDKREDRRGREDRFRRDRPITITVKDTPVFITDRGHMRILQWKMSQQKEQENLRFVLIGELSQDEMLKVAESLVSER